MLFRYVIYFFQIIIYVLKYVCLNLTHAKNQSNFFLYSKIKETHETYRIITMPLLTHIKEAKANCVKEILTHNTNTHATKNHV